MRPHATRRLDWAQLAMGACALVLPPLALGAAFYSMLAPDDGTTHPVEAEAVRPVVRPPPQAQVDLPAAAAIAPDAGQQPFSLPAEGSAPRDQTPAHLAPPNPDPARGAPVQVVTVPAVAVNPQAYAPEDAASRAESPSAAAAPKRPIPHRIQRQPQPPQQQDPIKTWLQQIGILPPYH
jgi:hypothetical protein